MSVTTTPATGAITFAGLSISAFIPGLDYGTLLGAFAGATLFVITNNEYGGWKKMALFFVSVVMGIYGADLCTGTINRYTPDGLNASRELGAVLAAATSVGLGSFVIKLAKNPRAAWKFIKGESNDRNNE